jgi:ADP-ribose pyrophosphatase YjhB (NUDIX family)
MKSEIEWRGQRYIMEWFDRQDFEGLKEVTQAYGFVFNKDKKVCVINCTGHWCLPGGHPESYDKSFEDTLRREVDEEADLDIKNIKRLGYFKITPLNDKCERKGVHYLLRYAAEVVKIKEQTIDPAVGIIPKRRFISPKSFEKVTGWKDNGNFQLKKAMEAIYESKI